MVVTWMFMNKALKKLTHTHTGINVIQSIVYSRGSNLTRIYFSRFYMFVLEKDDEIIAAASIRRICQQA
nr:unknown [Glycine max]